MESFIKALKSIDTIPNRIAFLVVLTCGSVLALPQSVTDSLRLTQFLESWGWVLGISLVASTFQILIKLSGWYFEKRKEYKHQEARDIKLRQALESLDFDERAVLREFFFIGRNTLSLPVDYPTIVGLRSKGIIVPIGRWSMSRIGRCTMMNDFKIAEHVEKWIFPPVLGFPEEFDDQRESADQYFKRMEEWAFVNRPQFLFDAAQENGIA